MQLLRTKPVHGAAQATATTPRTPNHSPGDSFSAGTVAGAQLTFRELSRRDELVEYFTLRHRVYSAQGYWKADSRTLDIDSYDRYSRFVGCYTATGEMIGGARFILPDEEPNGEAIDAICDGEIPPRPSAYYSQSAFSFDGVIDYARASGKQMVEFGRTVIHPDWQKAGLGVLLVHAIYGLAHCYGVSLGLATVPPRLTRFYCSLGCRLLHHRGVTQAAGMQTMAVPLVVDLQRLEGPLRLSLRAGRALRLRGAWTYSPGDQDVYGSPLDFAEWPMDPPGPGWEPVLSRLPLLRGGVTLQDGTLGYGLLSPSMQNPTLEAKYELLDLQVQLGIESVHLGFPAAAGWSREHVAALAAHCTQQRLPMQVSCSGRALVSDVRAIATVAAESGSALHASLFLGCSPQWQACQGWDLVRVLHETQQSLRAAVAENLTPGLVVEDAARTPAHILEPVYHTALQAGASSLCLSDSVGHATPRGVRALVRHARSFLDLHGYQARLEWHGHNDRQLAVANGLAAIEAGVDRVHATLGGCGDRVGGAPLEYLLVHLHRLSGRVADRGALSHYVRWGRQHLRWLQVGTVAQPLQTLPEVVS